MTTIKRCVEIEALVRWAYRDELSKRITSSAEGIWDRIAEDGRRGGIDPGHGAAQRYSHFGLPHPDAERIEKAIADLPDDLFDWDTEVGAVLGPLAGLVDLRSRTKAPAVPTRAPTAGWTLGGGRAAKVQVDRPRDVLMVRSLRTSMLITMHAGMGTRPRWRDEDPHPSCVSRGSQISIVGECWGKNLYAPGSYCPLQWSPSPIGIAEDRADYLAWWRGLTTLARTLDLQEFEPEPPEAAEMPWYTPEPVWTLVSAGTANKLSPLPLGPQRKRAGPRKSYPRASEVRRVAT